MPPATATLSQQVPTLNRNPARLSSERGLHELFQITRTLWAIGVGQWTRNIAASDPGEIPPKLADQGSAFAAVQG